MTLVKSDLINLLMFGSLVEKENCSDYRDNHNHSCHHNGYDDDSCFVHSFVMRRWSRVTLS